MYCVIQVIKLKKEILGCHKRIESIERMVGGEVEYSYIRSEERFIRPIKKSYKISIHHSYREDGKVKKKQWVIGTWEHYSLIENFFEFWKIEDKLQDMGISEDQLYCIVSDKLEPLIEKISREYHETEEYKVYKLNSEMVNKYYEEKSKFNKIYGYGYENCYDVFGELKNENKLNQILEDYKVRKEYEEKSKQYQYERYQRSYYSNNDSNYSSSGYSNNNHSNYNDDEKKLLKKIYKKMAMEFHPDRNLDKQEEAQEAMTLVNKLKEQWGV